MALKNTREANYPEWYQNVVAAAEMAENSVSPGCMVIKPWGYGIWENIRNIFDEKFRETGHDNCYFPMFIPLSFFQKEADHVEGFAKEMAVVTHSRLGAEDGKLVPQSPLDEPLIVRPTSETIIADSFAKWIKSYRDLPVLVNQWANVVRWEMRPRLFLRTREFLWQEGHTAHATAAEAEAETKQMLEIYRDVAENALALPVITGRKPEHEKFPGAVDTYCIEAMMQDGKALQAGTSHFLGQNFAKSAGISFVNSEGKQEFAYTTSWGVSTRLIGGLIMTHADDEGMAVPPRIAPYQVVLVPVIKNEADREKIMAYIEEVKALLKGLTPFGEKIRIKVDNRNKSSVDKFWEWTRKGAPVICEIGMRDAEGGKVMVKERLKLGTPEGKEIIAREEFARGLSERLENIQHEMFVRAKARLENNIRTDIVTHEEFEKYFANANRFIKDGDKNAVTFVRGKWSGDPNSEELLKALKITIRCIPFDQSGSKGECLLTGAKDATVDVIYARSY
ncbi:MAG: proline--tRNA ligase [Azospirillum sp. 51_20]|jgi:prolyl-tRNA synthetase|nr:MAG: proline--tRNA ligase [Azospirillum sp. 51_20]